MVHTMSKQVSGREHNLPRKCGFGDCPELTQNIIVTGCLERHIEDQYFCGKHTEMTIGFLKDTRMVCTDSHPLIAFKVREIHWEPSAFFYGQWILAGPGYRVLAVAENPEPLVKKMHDLPYSATIWQIRENGQITKATT